jgi:transcription antitermination factor NusG
MKHWYVLYTRGRWEKKVYSQLADAGVESYCPLNIVERRWSDRVKKVEEPIFKSYVFVKLSKEEHRKVLETPGVVKFVYWLGKPAIVREKEIEQIRKFLDEYDEVAVVPVDGSIVPGARLLITSGIFMDKEAIALKVFKKTVEVLIISIGCKLVATLESKRLMKV